tara:strand:+ start:908 stop:1201 length:294 start_codon:yes stop_codon:yes gene_type:complete
MKINAHVTRESYSTRGGGVEVKLDYLGYEGEFMSAHQNYLGGGMLGGVANDCSVPNWRDDVLLVKLAEHITDLYAERLEEELGIDRESYDNMPISAY